MLQLLWSIAVMLDEVRENEATSVVCLTTFGRCISAYSSLHPCVSFIYQLCLRTRRRKFAGRPKPFLNDCYSLFSETDTRALIEPSSVCIWSPAPFKMSLNHQYWSIDLRTRWWKLIQQKQPAWGQSAKDDSWGFWLFEYKNTFFFWNFLGNNRSFLCIAPQANTIMYVFIKWM